MAVERLELYLFENDFDCACQSSHLNEITCAAVLLQARAPANSPPLPDEVSKGTTRNDVAKLGWSHLQPPLYFPRRTTNTTGNGIHQWNAHPTSVEKSAICKVSGRSA